MIITDLLRRIRANDSHTRSRQSAPTMPLALDYPRLVTCNYCLSERVVQRAPRRPQFCSHRCQRKAITRIIHGMRVRYEMAQAVERRGPKKPKRKARAVAPVKVAA